MHFKNALVPVLAAGAALLVGAGSLRAATYSTFTGGDPGEGLDFEGIFPVAVNMAKNIGDASPTTIGGAAFQNITGVVGGDPVNQPPGISTGGSTSGNFYNADIGVAAPNFGASPDDVKLNGLMNSTWGEHFTISTSVGAPGSGARLVAGEMYKLQLFGLADNQPLPRDVQLYVEGIDLGVFDFANDVVGSANDGYTKAGGVLTHEFTAIDNFDGNFPPSAGNGFIDVAAIFPANSSGNLGFLAGFTIEAVPVPEPTSLCFLGLGGLAIMHRRRRHAV